MREIKFRGLTGNSEWVYGDLHNDIPNETAYYQEYPQRIVWFEGKTHCNMPIKKNTAGQFTGLFDKNDKEIYEGDILKHDLWGTDTVIWDEGCAMFRCVYEGQGMHDITMAHHQLGRTRVIGNIYENPELVANPEGR